MIATRGSDLQTNAHRLLQLFEAMRAQRPGTAFTRINNLNLSFSHLRLLHLLAPNRTLAMKELAEAMHITPPSVTTLVRRLVETGLVKRQAQRGDSRVVLVSLTAAGQALLRELYEEQLRNMDRLLQGLTGDEQGLFLDLMERAIQTMQAVPTVEHEQ